MSEFKPGDKVRCINHWEAYGLRNGEIYTVKFFDFNKQTITLEEIIYPLGAFRFVKAE